MKRPRTAILHYSSPPTVGGVESVMEAQAAGFVSAGYPVAVMSGEGDAAALAEGCDYIALPEMSSQHPEVLAISGELERGRVPPSFEPFTARLLSHLRERLADFDVILVHNILTKHFNLPLTAALARYLEERRELRCIAWCHDFTWTSPHSRSRVHDGPPWDLLRRKLPGVDYVTISARRRSELAGLFSCDEDEIGVIYNGVEPGLLLGLSPRGRSLAERLGLFSCEVSLLMPVRVTEAKNMEYAIHLAAALKERGAAPRIVVTGPPDPHDAGSMRYYEGLRALTRELAVQEEMRFVYSSGPDPETPLPIGMDTVSELYRVCDLLFMPSHREGFGMPILEAGLLGMPIVCTNVPAAEEIAGDRLLSFDPALDPGKLAERILAFVESSPTLGLRSEVRRRYTWQAIFERQIEPLLSPSRGGR